MTTVATGITNGAANGQTPAIISAYSAIDSTAVVANGGMWGAGGPSIDANGNVFVTTGDSPGGTGNPLGDFSNSVLEFAPGQTLQLTGVYTPWNYQTQDTIDSDLGGGSPIIVTLPAGSPRQLIWSPREASRATVTSPTPATISTTPLPDPAAQQPTRRSHQAPTRRYGCLRRHDRPKPRSFTLRH